MEVQVDILNIKSSLDKLISYLLRISSVNHDAVKNLWDIVEHLDSSKFIELQNNVYFADFLRNFEVGFRSSNGPESPTGIVKENFEELNCFYEPDEEITPDEFIDSKECLVVAEATKEVLCIDNTADIQPFNCSNAIAEDIIPPSSDKDLTKYYCGTRQLPNVNENLDDVFLPDRFMKLIRRLKNASMQNEWFKIGDKIQDLLDVKIDDLAKVTGIGSFYIETLKEIKSLYSNSALLEVREVFDIPDKNILIDEAILPDRFNKLIKRLRNASVNSDEFFLGDKIGDIVDLSPEEVSKLPGVGVSYVETLKEMKSLYHQDQDQDLVEMSSDLSINGIDSSNFLLSMSGLDQDFIKCLTKYCRHFELHDISDTVRHVLNFDQDELLKLPSFGRSTVVKLLQIKEIVKEEVGLILKGSINYLDLRSTIIIPKFIHDLDLNRIEQVLLDDIDNFLAKQSNDDADIAQCRWGFVEEHKTLEEVGKKLNVTRERIRQKEAEINNNFLLNLRINSSALWHLLEKHMAPSICVGMKDLFSCFSSEKTFFDFLGYVCKQKDLYDYVYPTVDKTLFNSYFAEFGAPLHINQALEIIEKELSGKNYNYKNVLESIQSYGNIFIKDECIWPRLLGKSEASACVLYNQPKGLPWMDIAKLVNVSGYSRTDIYDTRLDHEAFNDKDYIYLAGKGVYKHTRFIETDEIELNSIFEQLDLFSSKTAREVFHLNECYMASEYLNKIDYYVIRHFVKHFGEDFGYFFQGRSQADTVGRNKDFKRLTQKDVIIEALKSRDRPFTKPEIAALLKSKSIPHASFYLDGMLEDATVVQVDHQLYTTPLQAYKNIDLDAYLNHMSIIMEQCERPVDGSIFQKMLNNKFSVSYSKHFYMGIARCFSGRFGWFRAHGIYSLSPIPFSNLTDALNLYCSKDDPIKISVDRLQSHLAITSENATRLINSWRNTPE